MKKLRYIITHFFLGVLIIYLSTQCQQSPSQNHSYIDNLTKKILKYPIEQRLKKWDSLLISGNLSDIDKAYILFQNALDLSSIKKEDQAITDYRKALKIFQKYNIKEMIAKTRVNMGICYAYMNKKNRATQSLFKGLELATELNDTAIISRVYGELAHIYYLNHNLDKAIEYLKKTGDMYQKIKDTEGISAIYNNIAIIYKEQGKLKEAYEYTLKSMDFKKNLRDPISLIESYNNLGALTFLYTKDKVRALGYYHKALKLAKKSNYQPANVYENMADLYSETGQKDSAEYFLYKALSISSNTLKDQIQIYNKLLHNTLEKKNDTAALKLLKIKDSLTEALNKFNSRENQKAIESNLALLNKQKQLTQAQQLNKKNRIIFIFIILIFLLGLLISYQLNRLDRLNLKQNQFILEQKVLRSQMNPHFIFNVLSSIQNSLVENKPIISATYLSKFAQLIRQNFEYIQKRYINLNEELKMIRNYLETQKFRYKDKFDYQIIVDEDINQQATKIPPMILQPFVENAIEHGFKGINYKGQLTIKIYKNNNQICFEIIDNGNGFQPKNDHKEHALDIFKKRLKLMGKEAMESFKITKLPQGTKVQFCLIDFKKSN